MAKQKLPPLKELRFGQLDAGEEAIDEPDLLIEGFYDYREAAYGIASGQIWLLLGPKGAGKSAVIEHLKLRWHDRWDRFFVPWNLGNFPVTDVTRVQTGQSAGSSRAQSAWEFLLLLRIIDSLRGDEAVHAGREFHRVCSDLQNSGLLVGDWKTKVIEWTRMSAKLNLSIAEFGAEFENTTIGPLQISTILKKVLAEITTSSQHVIALDGLDSFFFEAEDEWTSLAGLMHAINSVNQYLRESRLPVSVVAAVRSDIFDVIPSAESNKLKPHSAHLDWSALGIGAGNHLWKLVTAKASVRRPEIRDLVKQYFHVPISVGPHSDIAEFFLDNTRLLPRDIIALMHHLQLTHPGSTPVTQGDAIEAVRRYCMEYFEGEIFNNLAGVLPTGSARKLAVFRDAMRTLPTRFFSFANVQSEVNGDLGITETKALLKQMFEIGGIGVRNYEGAVSHTDFVFRKVSGAGFTTRYGFVLHDALTRAWNRPWWPRPDAS